MNKLNTLKAKVEEVLRNFPDTRSDDRKLIRVVYYKYYNVHSYDAFGHVLMNTKLPSFESIRRCRQKIQEHDESLRGTDESEQARMNKQIEYIEFAQQEGA